jgi:outer membrane protein assembly factor BamB
MIEPLLVGDPRSAGEFRLRARLGAGGMGQVFLGYSPGGRAVAVKICHPDFAADPAFVQRFAMEVAAARAVNGLYTAQVIDAGPDDSPPWLATSYVPGPSLYEAVNTDGPLPEAAVWRLAAGLAEALRAVHDRGLVHRDLKPTNVLLAADGPRVIDFGVARALDGTSLTTTGITFGTPSYMSPEQGMGDPLGPVSDVFSFGCVLCFAATGRVPFGDGDAPAVLYRIVHAEPVLDGVPGSLRGLVTACLAKNPAERPALAQILHACQADTLPGSQGPGYPGAASFWPGPVAALIDRHQAELRDASAALEPPGEATLGGGAPLAGRLATWPPADRVAAPPPAGRRGQGSGPTVSRRRVLAGAGGAVLAAGLAASGWALTHRGRTAGTAGPADTTASRLAWSRQTGGPVTSGAAIAGGVTYIGSADGYVHAFEAATGRPTRTFPVHGAVTAAVTIAGQSLLAGSADHGVYALPITADGPSWRRATGAAVHCQPVAGDGGVVYAGSDDGYVYALHADSGLQIWRHRTGGAVRMAPLTGHEPATMPKDSWFYAGSDDGYVYQLSVDSGQQFWRFHTGGAVTSGLTLGVDTGLYAASDDGNLFMVSGDKSQSWRFPAGGAIRGAPAIAGNTIYVASDARKVHAVTTLSGDEIWSCPVGGEVRSGLAVSGTALYAGCEDGYLYAIDITRGRTRWRYRTGSPVRSKILVAGGLVYFGSLDGRVYALHAD